MQAGDAIGRRGRRLKEVKTVQWDLGLEGIAVLAVMSLGFGVFTHLLLWRHETRWAWLIAAAAFFVMGLFISEGLFGWATVEELQPNIDGLSLDEVLLGFLISVPALLVAHYVTRRAGHHPATP
jgi:hypothetical protein